MPAEPAPFTTTLISDNLRFVRCRALITPADVEALGRLDVFEVDAAEARPQIAHAIDEGLDVAGVDFQIDGIHVGEALEQDALALHDRLRRERAKIAETEDRRAVRDHGHHVAARRVVESGIRPFGDGAHRHGDAGRIGERQVALRRHGFGRRDLELSGLGTGVKGEGFLLRERGAFCRGHGRYSYLSADYPLIGPAVSMVPARAHPHTTAPWGQFGGGLRKGRQNVNVAG